MNTHIDTLKEWWESAEQATGHAGDTVIRREEDGETYQVYTLDAGPIGLWGDVRILARAPKPKPAWHNAVAVMADDGDGDRMVWVRADEQGKAWESADGFIRHPSDLNNATPLIEAKVTDEMVERGAQASTPAGVRYLRPYEVREVLNAALGIEAE